MIVKEEDKMLDLVIVQTGDQVKKSTKNGQVIEVNDEGVLVMWKDGKMTIEDPESLTMQNNPFTEYLRRIKRL